MKRSAKLSVFFLVLILVCSMFVLSASAATTTQDGLEVTLTADKTEYKADEQINAKLTVKNKEAVDVSSVSLEALIPDGYKLADNTSGKKTVGTLKSGDSAELSVTYIPSKDLNVTELSNNTDSENKTNNTNSNTNTTNNTSNTTNNVKNDNTSPNPVVQSDNVLKTGDSHAYIVYIVVFMMSGVFAFVMVKKKRGKQLLSILLCITLIGAIIPLGDILVYAVISICRYPNFVQYCLSFSQKPITLFKIVFLF